MPPELAGAIIGDLDRVIYGRLHDHREAERPQRAERRSATAQIHAVSDPIPTILKGIPLDIGSIALSIDRPQHRSPRLHPQPDLLRTDVDPGRGHLGLQSERQPYQPVSGRRLRGPRLRTEARPQAQGGDQARQYPKLRAVLRAKKGQANIGRVSVALPHSAFLAQAHIRTICTRVQFAAAECPEGSIYGYATATTPLLDRALERGPVYLRRSIDLVARRACWSTPATSAPGSTGRA